MLTGRYPSRHGAASMAAPLDERGFDEMHWTKYIQGKRAGSGMAEIAIDWLNKRAADPANNSQRFFLFLHMMDVHSDYASTERYETIFADQYQGPIDGTTQQLYRHLLGELTVETAAADHLRSLYDAGIRQLDDSLGRLLAVLEKQGRNRDTLIVLTSDHGEEFLEHGGVLHGHTQYEEVVRVPLIVAGPGVPHKTIADPVSLIDIVPTVLDLLDEPEVRALDGRSLKPALEGRTLRNALFTWKRIRFSRPENRGLPTRACTVRCVRPGSSFITIAIPSVSSCMTSWQNHRRNGTSQKLSRMKPGRC